MNPARAFAAAVLLLFSGCGKSEPLTNDPTPVNSGPSPEPSVAAASPAAPAAEAASPAPSVPPVP